MNIVTVAWIYHKDKLLLIFHKKHKKWLPVGGHMESGEDVHQTLKREIKEEIGLTEVNYLMSENISDGYEWCPLPFYLRTMDTETGRETHLEFVGITSTDKITPLDNEIQEYKWFTQEEINKDTKIQPIIKTLAKLSWKAKQLI